MVDKTVGEWRNLDDYRRYLTGLHVFRAPLETAIAAAPWPQALTGWRPTLIAAEIARDMDDVGVPARVGEVKGERYDLPKDPHALMGALYVLEGSSLGARLLWRRAQDLGLDETRGARHLAAQTASDARWRDYIDRLEAMPDLDIERSVQAANAIFHAAHRALESPAYVQP